MELKKNTASSMQIRPGVIIAKICLVPQKSIILL